MGGSNLLKRLDNVGSDDANSGSVSGYCKNSALTNYYACCNLNTYCEVASYAMFLFRVITNYVNRNDANLTKNLDLNGNDKHSVETCYTQHAAHTYLVVQVVFVDEVLMNHKLDKLTNRIDMYRL